MIKKWQVILGSTLILLFWRELDEKIHTTLLGLYGKYVAEASSQLA